MEHYRCVREGQLGVLELFEQETGGPGTMIIPQYLPTPPSRRQVLRPKCMTGDYDFPRIWILVANSNRDNWLFSAELEFSIDEGFRP